jgi:Arc/MetJ-type ribon-helix-helix transcriptional regulator
MRIIVDLPNALLRRAHALIESGSYESLNEAIVAALETQLTLEETEAGPAVVAREITKGALAAAGPDAARSVRQLAWGDKLGDGQAGAAPDVSPRVPAEVRRPIQLHVAPSEMPELAATSDREYWLWGVNRVAPVKAAARIAMALAAGSGGKVALGTLHDVGADIARRVGDYLAAHDKSTGRKHGDRLSSGFPRSGKDGTRSAKSANRFGEFFFGTVRRRTQRIDGALYELRLVSIGPSEDGSDVVVPTEAGIEFARLQSPILDGEPSALTRGLSDEEAAWYISHVKENVPREHKALTQGMGYVRSSGGDTEKFLHAMGSDYPGLSEKALSTVRVCVLGRLLDLGLVKRDAVSVYRVTRDSL